MSLLIDSKELGRVWELNPTNKHNLVHFSVVGVSLKHKTPDHWHMTKAATRILAFILISQAPISMSDKEK